MLGNKQINEVVFFSMKTVSRAENYESLPAHEKELFMRKYEHLIASWYPKLNRDERQASNDALQSVYSEMGALSPEFGKIACISIGSIIKPASGNVGTLKVVSFCDEQEKNILDSFFTKAVKTFGAPKIDKDFPLICGHAIKSFHLPFLAKRCLAHGKTPLSPLLDSSEVKPWEMTYVADTMEAWKMTDWSGNTSLDLVANTLGITRPRDIIRGKEVNHAYWSEKDMKRVQAVCEDDLRVLAEIYIKMKGIDFKFA